MPRTFMSQQERLLGLRAEHVRYVRNIGSGTLSHHDAEDIVSDVLSRPERWLKAGASDDATNRHFYRSLHDGALEYLRRRDGQSGRVSRRTGRPLRRRRMATVSLHAPRRGHDGTGQGDSAIGDAIADTRVDVAGEAIATTYPADHAVLIVERAMKSLKPIEQELLKLRVHYPEFSVRELAELVGLQERQAEYRLIAARRKFRAAVQSVRLTAECDTTRSTLLMPAAAQTAGRLANVDAHCEECDPCRLWAMAYSPTPERYRRVAALLPLPAAAAGPVARLTNAIQRLWPFGDSATSHGEVVGGGLIALLGGTKVVCVLCAAGAIGVTGGTVAWSTARPESAPRAQADDPPAATRSPAAILSRPAALPVSPTPSASRSGGEARRARDEQSAADRRRTAAARRERDARDRAARAGEDEFGPQATPASPPATSPGPAATPPPAQASAPAPTPLRQTPEPAGPASSNFQNEFTP